MKKNKESGLITMHSYKPKRKCRDQIWKSLNPVAKIAQIPLHLINQPDNMPRLRVNPATLQRYISINAQDQMNHVFNIQIPSTNTLYHDVRNHFDNFPLNFWIHGRIGDTGERFPTNWRFYHLSKIYYDNKPICQEKK